MLLQQQQRREEEAAARKESTAGTGAKAAAATAEGEEEEASSHLVAVARSLSKGALEFVRPLGAQGKGDPPAAATSDKIAEPIDAEAFAAAVASQKRISLSPELVVLDKPIDEQGEHLVPLRMKVGGERVMVRALVGLAAAAAGGEDERKGAKKKGGKR